MTLEDLTQAVRSLRSIGESDAYFEGNFPDVRPLFYGLTRAELESNKFDYEQLYYAFANSEAGAAYQNGPTESRGTLAFLYLCVSLFHRAALSSVLQNMTVLLPESSLRKRASAISLYKHIGNTRRDYTDRFDEILRLLTTTSHDQSPGAARCSAELVLEYEIEAIHELKKLGPQAVDSVRTLVQSQNAWENYPLLLEDRYQRVFDWSDEKLDEELLLCRIRIAEYFHSEACTIVEQYQPVDDHDAETTDQVTLHQQFLSLPNVLDTEIMRLDGTFNPRHQEVSCNYFATGEDNQRYLGTYFPRTVVEAWNIFSELLSIPEIQSSFRQKDSLNILDLGSGTGGAIAGFLLAFRTHINTDAQLRVVSVDANQDALDKQKVLLDVLAADLGLTVKLDILHNQLPFTYEQYDNALAHFAMQHEAEFSVVMCWKYLCEFYNTYYTSALGIIGSTLRNFAKIMTPDALCILSDVTTKDNGYEFFSMTLNRESNDYSRQENARLRTIVPIPCACKDPFCSELKCFTQRVFNVRHALAPADRSKIAYRVFAPSVFAGRIVKTYPKHSNYRVNAARPHESCLISGDNPLVAENPVCGYTAFRKQGGS